MAHADQRAFIALVMAYFPEYFEKVSVLEVGSLDINGSIRNDFRPSRYVGVDVGEGPGVDQICPGQLLDFPTGSFDVAVSCECMEHNPFWVETLANMFRMTRTDGLVIMSCATIGRGEHGTTRTTKEHSPLTVGIGWEYYRNLSVKDVSRALPLDWWFADYFIMPNWEALDLYFVGIRKPGTVSKQAFPALKAAMQKQFGALRSPRSAAVALTAGLFGRHGVDALHDVYVTLRGKRV